MSSSSTATAAAISTAAAASQLRGTRWGRPGGQGEWGVARGESSAQPARGEREAGRGPGAQWAQRAQPGGEPSLGGGAARDALVRAQGRQGARPRKKAARGELARTVEMF